MTNMTDPLAHLSDPQLRADNERLHRFVEHLAHKLLVAQAELAHKDRELATLARQYELRRANDIAWWAKQGEEADRRFRFDWWLALGLVLGGFLMGLLTGRGL